MVSDVTTTKVLAPSVDSHLPNGCRRELVRALLAPLAGSSLSRDAFGAQLSCLLAAAQACAAAAGAAGELVIGFAVRASRVCMSCQKWC